MNNNEPQMRAEQVLFERLFEANVSSHVEKRKNGKEELSYLTWAWAWAELLKIVPDASYKIKMFDGKPYVYDEILGYMVFTEMTLLGMTRECWLPVLNGNLKPMLSKPYEYETKWGKNRVEKATMFDINRAIMRCLTKNIAMFGLGLKLYAGEDLTENTPEVVDPTFTQEQASKAMERYGEAVIAACEEMGYSVPTQIPLSRKNEFFAICKKFSEPKGE